MDIKINDKCLFLLTERHRYKVAYGGRGSGKSYSFADALLIKSLEKKRRILCARQLQTSIRDSVHKLLSDRIDALGLTPYFEITREQIRAYNGSEFIFKGVQNNVQEIKSTEGIDICWCEEAASITQESWDVLIPTIRKEGAEVWITFNPDREEDPTYKMFVKQPVDDCKAVLMNYNDNPFFPETLRKEMEYCKRVDFSKYENVWLGQPATQTDVQVFRGKFEQKEFETPENVQFYWGCDWGFSCLVGDTKIKTQRGNIPIKDISVGDYVLTRDGYKKVLFTKNKGIQPVFKVSFGKKSLIATGDHRIYTANGWKCVKDLKSEEKVCILKLSLTGVFINAIQTASTRIIFILKKVVEKKKGFIIGTFGSFIMAQFRKVMSFITLTSTRLTIPLKTLFASRLLNIQKSIIKKGLVRFPLKLWQNTEKKTGIHTKIGQNEERSLYKQHKIDAEFVKNAEESTRSQMFIKNIVARIVERVQTLVQVKKNIFVKFAENTLRQVRIIGVKPVQTNARISCQPLTDKKEVFDITVENGEFFANGILVHNCDPTVLVRCFIKDKCLYIDHEAYGVGVEMDELPQLFDSIPDSRKWVIRADCARPETIAYVKRHGFNCIGAEKWKGSIEDGIEYIRSFEKIYIHPRCKHTYDEFKFYSYKKDRISGDILPIIVDAWNHCIDGLRYALQPYIKNKGKMIINNDWDVDY